MNISNFTDEEHLWRNIATRIALMAVTIAAIVSFLPKSEAAHFRYDVGKPWMQGTVIAKFQFPVYKSEEAINVERDSIVSNFQPYYRIDANVEKRALDKFAEDFPQMLALVSNVKYTIIQELYRIYQTGIMSDTEYARMANDTTNSIRIVDGKEALSVPITQVYSPKTAYEQLFKNKMLAELRQVIQGYNMTNYLQPNLVYDQKRSDTERNELLNSIVETDDVVMAGQKIIDKGEIVTNHTARILASLEKEMQKRKMNEAESKTRLGGQIALVGILVFLFTCYIALFRNDYFSKPRAILLVYAMLIIFPVFVSLMVQHIFLSVYILPFAMVPIFIRIFMDSRTTSMAHTVNILLCSVAVKYQYEFVIVQLVAGMVAIYTLRELSKRSQVLRTALAVMFAEAVTYYALQLIQSNELIPADAEIYIHFLINGLLLLLVYPLMYVIERLAGFTSSVTLFELSDTNKDLLRQLSEVAPGTFQHSIMVGNLAAEIANKIGAKGLLVRTGALYHDIGKMVNPVFFTENQANVNPHDNLSEKESARIIISHVTEGVKLAEKYNLPRVIKDFILTHHGTGVTKYFYVSYKNAHPDEEIDMEDFTYPGPNPFTKEQAILMMADGVEAASRSLSEYTEESISTLVSKIVDRQVNEGAFTECPITFRDIAVAKSVLINRLKSIYHTRISYPELKHSETADAPDAADKEIEETVTIT